MHQRGWHQHLRSSRRFLCMASTHSRHSAHTSGSCRPTPSLSSTSSTFWPCNSTENPKLNHFKQNWVTTAKMKRYSNHVHVQSPGVATSSLKTPTQSRTEQSCIYVTTQHDAARLVQRVGVIDVMTSMTCNRYRSTLVYSAGGSVDWCHRLSHLAVTTFCVHVNQLGGYAFIAVISRLLCRDPEKLVVLCNNYCVCLSKRMHKRLRSDIINYCVCQKGLGMF